MHWKEHDTDILLFRTCATHGIVFKGAGVGAVLWLLLRLDGGRDGGEEELPALASAFALIRNLVIMS